MPERLSRNEISLENHVRASKLTRKLLLTVVETAARVARKPSRRMHIILVGDKKMCQLNAAYRGNHKTTDVLSFPSLDLPPRARTLGYSLVRDDQLYLGEIVLCIPQLRRQARAYGVPFQVEVVRMAIHGFLHVWGYDHIKPRDARVMMPLQERILTKIMKGNTCSI